MIKKFLKFKFLPVILTTCMMFLTSCNQGKALDLKGRVAVVETTKGTFKFVLFEDKAPITTKNFIELVQSKFYDGLTFHRYEPGFVIQGGDPKGDGSGGSPKTIPLEVNAALIHNEGAVGMARSQSPDSASSQFYVTLAPAHSLDNAYAVFGFVTEGMDVVQKLRVGDKMKKITVVNPKPENKDKEKK